MGELAGLHVLIVPSWWPSPEQPFAGVFFKDYVRAFSAAGCRIGVVYPDLVRLRYWRPGIGIPLRPRLERDPSPDGPVYRVRGLHTALRTPAIEMHRFRRWLARGLRQYLREHGPPQVLHAMCAVPAGWACTHLPVPNGARPLPVVVTEHTGPFSLVMNRPSMARHVRAALSHAAAVVAVSERSRADMRQAGITRDLRVCGNPVADEFTKPTVSEPTGPRLRLLFVGRLTVEKGVIELVRAAASLDAARNVEWHFAGDGPLSSRIEAAMTRAGLREQLTLHGVCDRPGVARLMAESHALILPTHGENFPLAVAEALSMGLPVLTTRNTGAGDLLQDGDGILVDVGDVDGLSAAVRRLIDGISDFDRRAIAARARARFDGRRVAAWYTSLFCEVLGAARRGGRTECAASQD